MTTRTDAARLPLQAVAVVSWNAMILDADNEELCMVYGVGAAELTRDLVNAINERAANKERIAHLEGLIKKWR